MCRSFLEGAGHQRQHELRRGLSLVHGTSRAQIAGVSRCFNSNGEPVQTEGDLTEIRMWGESALRDSRPGRPNCSAYGGLGVSERGDVWTWNAGSSWTR